MSNCGSVPRLPEAQMKIRDIFRKSLEGPYDRCMYKFFLKYFHADGHQWTDEEIEDWSWRLAEATDYTEYLRRLEEGGHPQEKDLAVFACAEANKQYAALNQERLAFRACLMRLLNDGVSEISEEQGQRLVRASWQFDKNRCPDMIAASAACEKVIEECRNAKNSAPRPVHKSEAERLHAQSRKRLFCKLWRLRPVCYGERSEQLNFSLSPHYAECVSENGDRTKLAQLTFCHETVLYYLGRIAKQIFCGEPSDRTEALALRTMAGFAARFCQGKDLSPQEVGALLFGVTDYVHDRDIGVEELMNRLYCGLPQSRPLFTDFFEEVSSSVAFMLQGQFWLALKFVERKRVVYDAARGFEFFADLDKSALERPELALLLRGKDY
jgi:hypothetical protein